jgi:cytochrome bd ubiquinol oxidase subunit II
MLADVPMVFILAGITAYAVLAGADFGAGIWTLWPGHIREHARHAMGPVWEANHVWLIFILVVAWTCYPGAYGAVVSTLSVPLFIAAIGIIFRGAAYALRGQLDSGTRLARVTENLFALSSVLTPFALGTVIGAIATGRVPVGNAAGNLVTSWLNPVSILTGVLAVAFSGYLAAVYLAADARRLSERAVVPAFRTRALLSGVVAGALALGGLAVVRSSAHQLWHGLTSGAGLALVCVCAVAGIVTMALVWRSAFGLARASAALAVAAVIAGWVQAQRPYLLPGLTIGQAAAGRATLIATIVSVGGGAVVLIPSLILLYTLFLRGKLDVEPEPVLEAAAPAAAVPAAAAPVQLDTVALTRRPQVPLAVVTLVAGAILMVFGGPAWTQVLGAVCLIACAVTVFTLAAPDDGQTVPAGRHR